MANTAQARKRARQNTKRRQNSASQRSMVRTYLKRVDAAIAAKDYDAATEAYKKAVPVLDRMAEKDIIHRLSLLYDAQASYKRVVVGDVCIVTIRFPWAHQ